LTRKTIAAKKESEKLRNDIKLAREKITYLKK